MFAVEAVVYKFELVEPELAEVDIGASDADTEEREACMVYTGNFPVDTFPYLLHRCYTDNRSPDILRAVEDSLENIHLVADSLVAGERTVGYTSEQVADLLPASLLYVRIDYQRNL